MAEATAEEKAKTGKEGEQKPETDPQKLRIAQLETENAALLKETVAKKEQIRDLETKKKAEEEEQLKSQQKYKELYEGSLPKAKRAEELEPVVADLINIEIADIPEEKRELIPNFEKPEQKLLWIRKAKSQGLFTPVADPKGEKGGKGKLGPDGKPLPATVQSKVNTDGTTPEFLTWSPNDPRLASLSIPDFRQWQAHNRPQKTGVVGWGTSQK